VTCHRWATLLHSCPSAAMHTPGSRKQVLVVVPMSDIYIQVDFPPVFLLILDFDLYKQL
jgi:hypothetical protein